jgi:hypothetical protein
MPRKAAPPAGIRRNVVPDALDRKDALRKETSPKYKPEKTGNQDRHRQTIRQEGK